MTGIYDDVVSEWIRQERLKTDGKFAWTCRDIRHQNGALITPAEKLAVVAEEFGEVSREVVEGLIKGKPDLIKLRKELIETAACCLAWVAAIDDTAG